MRHTIRSMHPAGEVGKISFSVHPTVILDIYYKMNIDPDVRNKLSWYLWDQTENIRKRSAG